MCGGRGTRLESEREKPLYPIDGVAMVDRVLTALEASAVDTVYTAVSPNAPATAEHLDGREGIRSIETPGEGYVSDLLALLERPAVEPPVLTVAADLPLLAASVVDRVLANHGDSTASRTVCVPVSLKHRLGVSVETRLGNAPHLAPTGVNVVGSSDRSMTHVSYDFRLAVNVNRLEDARLAETRCAEARCE
jgi:adenosylcobinamide-phosphate guanylyltransferase